MPLIDVSPVLLNPIFQDTFTVNRRQQLVNSYGEVSTSVAAYPSTVGVVYPSDENDLNRLADMDIQAKAITVITTFALRGESETGSGAGQQFKPDVVVWNGDNFIVRAVDDWSNYAAGFIKAICSSIDAVDQPPAG